MLIPPNGLKRNYPTPISLAAESYTVKIKRRAYAATSPTDASWGFVQI